MIMCSAEIAKKFNFNKAVFPGIQGGPLMHVVAAKAVCLKEALQPEYKEYQKNIVKNAKALCDGLLKRGINIVSGTTENHLMLVDLRGTGVTGKAWKTCWMKQTSPAIKMPFPMTRNHRL